MSEPSQTEKDIAAALNPPKTEWTTDPVASTALLAAQEELAKYVGIPKCMDCKWKLGSDITNNCGCMGQRADRAKHDKAFKRARELQAIISANAEVSHVDSEKRS